MLPDLPPRPSLLFFSSSILAVAHSASPPNSWGSNLSFHFTGSSPPPPEGPVRRRAGGKKTTTKGNEGMKMIYNVIASVWSLLLLVDLRMAVLTFVFLSPFFLSSYIKKIGMIHLLGRRDSTVWEHTPWLAWHSSLWVDLWVRSIHRCYHSLQEIHDTIVLDLLMDLLDSRALQSTTFSIHRRTV